jgi:phosphoribosylglycinamide formyltransferase-1
VPIPAGPDAPARVVVLVSGGGTNLQALIDASAAGALPGAALVGVLADRPGIEGLDRAERAGIAAQVVAFADHDDRAAWDLALREAIAAFAPDLVVCAGFMRILGAPVLDAFTLVNTHPALLPSFPGAHGVRDALDYGVKVTGCTVHFVDAGVDTGPVIAQGVVEIDDADDEASLHERIKVVERRLLVDVVARLCRDGWSLDGRKVTIP